MKISMRSVLRWWHLAFGVVALFFAALYLRDGLAEGGATSDKLKGGAWVALALFMIVPEFVRRRKNSHRDAG